MSDTPLSRAPVQAFAPPQADEVYLRRRAAVEHYFDRTAAQAWARLTSEAPVGRIRATVRAGRDRMRETLLGWLPADLRGQRLLDLGCGTGALAVEAARRGAEVVAVDLSPTLVRLARERCPAELAAQIDWRSGDATDPALGRFDQVVAMDSLIHYRLPDALAALAAVAARTRGQVLFTYAPRTPLLAVMHAVGRCFPRGDRSPALQPFAPLAVRRQAAAHPGLAAWEPGREARVAAGFYISQAQELRR